MAATVTASYDPATQHLSLAGCGYDPSEVVSALYTLPDGSQESYLIGMLADGCMDNNFITTSATGSWDIKVYQTIHKKFVLQAETTITV